MNMHTRNRPTIELTDLEYSPQPVGESRDGKDPLALVEMARMKIGDHVVLHIDGQWEYAGHALSFGYAPKKIGLRLEVDIPSVDLASGPIEAPTVSGLTDKLNNRHKQIRSNQEAEAQALQLAVDLLRELDIRLLENLGYQKGGSIVPLCGKSRGNFLIKEPHEGEPGKLMLSCNLQPELVAGLAEPIAQAKTEEALGGIFGGIFKDAAERAFDQYQSLRESFKRFTRLHAQRQEAGLSA